MATCGSIVASIGVLNGDSSYKKCLRAVRRSWYGGQGCVFQMERRLIGCTVHRFSKGLNGCISSSNSDGVVSDVSWDGSLISEQTNPKSDDDALKLISGERYLPSSPAKAGKETLVGALLFINARKGVSHPDDACSWDNAEVLAGDGSLLSEKYHPTRLLTGGDDAYFIPSEDEQAVGVADGVRGWADLGGDNYRELMSKVLIVIPYSLDRGFDPLLVLRTAQYNTKVLGYPTAFIIALKNQNCLHILDCGSRGFIVVRDGNNLIFKSPIQPHLFKISYQPDSGDLTSSGQVFEIPAVLPGDAIVSGSHSLFENLSSKEVATIVRDAVNENLSPDATARRIAFIARERALDRKHGNPSEDGVGDFAVVVSFVSNSTTNA